MQSQRLGYCQPPRLIRMQVDFVVSVGNSRRIAPAMQALIGFFGIIALVDRKHFYKAGAGNKMIVAVWMVCDIVLFKPVLNGQLHRNTVRAGGNAVFLEGGSCWPRRGFDI